jgi:hypothetical protein
MEKVRLCRWPCSIRRPGILPTQTSCVVTLGRETLRARSNGAAHKHVGDSRETRRDGWWRACSRKEQLECRLGGVGGAECIGSRGRRRRRSPLDGLQGAWLSGASAPENSVRRRASLLLWVWRGVRLPYPTLPQPQQLQQAAPWSMVHGCSRM